MMFSSGDAMAAGECFNRYASMIESCTTPYYQMKDAVSLYIVIQLE